MTEPSLNRVIRLNAQPGEVRIVVEDDFHHFRVRLLHDGKIVKDVTSATNRSPYSLCIVAGNRLRELVGMELTTDMTAAFRQTNARLQCTHQHDIAAVAITAAARGTNSCKYYVRVPDAVDGKTRPELFKDDNLILQWDLDYDKIVGPKPYVDLGLGGGFTSWVAENLSHEEAEAALVLRRGIYITRGRHMGDSLDDRGFAPSGGGCWVQQPERYRDAIRNKKSVFDFTDRVEELTSKDEDWLAFDTIE